MIVKVAKFSFFVSILIKAIKIYYDPQDYFYEESSFNLQTYSK